MLKINFLFFVFYFFLISHTLSQNQKRLSIQSKLGVAVFESDDSYLNDGGINLTQGIAYHFNRKKDGISFGILLDIEFRNEYKSRSLALPLKYHCSMNKLGFSVGLILVKHNYLKIKETEIGDTYSALVYNSTGQAHWTNTQVETGRTKLEKKVAGQFILGGHYLISPSISLDLELSLVGKGDRFANTASIGISYLIDIDKI